MTSASQTAESLIDITALGADEAGWLATIRDARLPAWHPGSPGNIVVVSPHPDDETLAVGGLLHDLASLGWHVSLVAVTDGEAAYPGVADLAAIRRQELTLALERLGLTDATTLIQLGIPDGAVGQHGRALTAQLYPVVIRASWVLAPWPGDGHPDHEAAGCIAAEVAGELGVPARFFPVWAWHFMAPRSPAASELLAHAEQWPLSAAALAAKGQALSAFASQRDGQIGPAILPPHVLGRFGRPFEVVLR